MEHRLSSNILKHVPKDKQDEFKRNYITSRPVLDAIRSQVQEMISKNTKILDDFTDAAWPYKAANCRGYERALEEILKLLP